MSAMRDIYLTTTQKAVSQSLDEMLKRRGVPVETRDAMINSFEMMYEYIGYAIEQKENPSSGKVLAKFLATKGSKMVKYLGVDTLNCGIAIVDLLKSGTAAVQLSASPGAVILPAPIIAWGLATLDLIEVGNSCEFAQSAYYHLFIKESSHVKRRSEAAAGSLNKLH